MYAPAPPRLKKTGIVRSRSGCGPCRDMRRKCDERKPSCDRCERNGRQCRYDSSHFRFCDASTWAANKSSKARGQRATTTSAQARNMSASSTGFAHGGQSNSGILVAAREASPNGVDIPPMILGHDSVDTLTVRSPIVHWATFEKPSLFPLTLSDLEYLAHFDNHVLEVLPSSLGLLKNFLPGHEFVLYAAMAISAGNKANIHRGLDTTGHHASWTPEPSHKAMALMYATKSLSLATKNCNVPSAGVLIAAHMLLSFLELEIGTIDGLRRHLQCIDNLVYNTWHHLTGSCLENRLLSAVAQYRLLQRYEVGFCGPVNHSNLQNLFWKTLEGETSIDSLGLQKLGDNACFALQRAWACTVIRECPTLAQKLLASRAVLFLQSETRGNESLSELDICQIYESARADLEEFSRQIEQFRVPFGLPTIETKQDLINVMSKEVHVSYSTLLLSLGPSRSLSYEEAMAAAEYAFGRIMCTHDLHKSYRSILCATVSNSVLECRYWLAVLMWIAKNANMNECALRNAYRTGMGSMLISCLYTFGHIELLDFIEEHLRINDICKDIKLPPSLVLSVLRAIRDILEEGKIIHMVHVADDLDLHAPISPRASVSNIFVSGVNVDLEIFNDRVHLK